MMQRFICEMARFVMEVASCPAEKVVAMGFKVGGR